MYHCYRFHHSLDYGEILRWYRSGSFLLLPGYWHFVGRLKGSLSFLQWYPTEILGVVGVIMLTLRHPCFHYLSLYGAAGWLMWLNLWKKSGIKEKVDHLEKQPNSSCCHFSDRIDTRAHKTQIAHCPKNFHVILPKYFYSLFYVSFFKIILLIVSIYELPYIKQF